MTNIEDMLDELEGAAFYEGTEIGEYWEVLANLYSFRCSFSKEFEVAYAKELEREYRHFKKNFKFVEDVASQTSVTKRLIHVDELG